MDSLALLVGYSSKEQYKVATIKALLALAIVTTLEVAQSTPSPGGVANVAGFKSALIMQG